MEEHPWQREQRRPRGRDKLGVLGEHTMVREEQEEVEEMGKDHKALQGQSKESEVYSKFPGGTTEGFKRRLPVHRRK